MKEYIMDNYIIAKESDVKSLWTKFILKFVKLIVYTDENATISYKKIGDKVYIISYERRKNEENKTN